MIVASVLCYTALIASYLEKFRGNLRSQLNGQKSRLLASTQCEVKHVQMLSNLNTDKRRPVSELITYLNKNGGF